MNRVLPWPARLLLREEDGSSYNTNHSSIIGKPTYSWLESIRQKVRQLTGDGGGGNTTTTTTTTTTSGGDGGDETTPVIIIRPASEFNRLTDMPDIMQQPRRQSKSIPRARIVVLAVNGWFPEARLMQTIFGEPVGTSQRFCMHFHAAFQQFLQAHSGGREQSSSPQPPLQSLNSDDVEITLIPLSAAATATAKVRCVMDRVDYHWSELLLQLQTHRNKLDRATHLFVLAHSQGSLVATILLHRMLTLPAEQPLVSAQRCRILLLSMAGISHGPFPWIKKSLVLQYVETAAAARELFDFCYAAQELSKPSLCDNQAAPSIPTLSLLNDTDDRWKPPTETVRHYWTSMNRLLASGVYVLAVGSYLDQVVPLYSALMLGWSHPNLRRAIYFDHYNYRGDEDFLVSLLTLLTEMRNRGIADHNLLVYLSDYLSGSLYGGVSEHSTVYDEPQVYQLAMELLFFAGGGGSSNGDSNNVSPLKSSRYAVTICPFPIVSLRYNPNYIPWSMHQLLINPAVWEDKLMAEKLRQTLKLLKDWRPSERPFRELLYRLHPVTKFNRSNL